MNFINNLFGTNFPSAVTLTVLFIVLLIALLIAVWLVRKLFGGSSVAVNNSRQPRLSVTDAAIVDETRRLVLVRRDDVEHLVMIGGPTDIVVEQNISRLRPVAATINTTTQEYVTPSAPPAPVISEVTKNVDKAVDKTSAALGSVAVGAAAIGTSAVSSVSSATGGVTAGAGSLASAAGDTAQNAVSAVADTAASAKDAVVEKINDVAAEAPDISSISDDAVSLVTPAPKAATGDGGSAGKPTPDSEMASLLDELAAETKI